MQVPALFVDVDAYPLYDRRGWSRGTLAANKALDQQAFNRRTRRSSLGRVDHCGGIYRGNRAARINVSERDSRRGSILSRALQSVRYPLGDNLAAELYSQSRRAANIRAAPTRPGLL